MRVLALSDMESRYYYDYYTDGKLSSFDLIIACGDLRREYLEFLVTMAGCPLLYVRGNHDDRLISEPPEGCVCIDGSFYVYKGIRFVGLGGSYRYRSGDCMYTERQMKRRILRLLPPILLHGGFDVLVTHAPARGRGDFDALSHRGFECFNTLLRRWHPAYFVHGHIHKNYGPHIPQKTVCGSTTIINAFEHCVFEI